MLVKLSLQYGRSSSTYDVLAVPLLIEADSDKSVAITIAGSESNESCKVDVTLPLLEKAFRDAARENEAVLDLTPSGVSALKAKYESGPAL
jgi:hypothetical protein